MLTADTITDEQIRELRLQMGDERFDKFGQSWSIWQVCMDAMHRPDYGQRDARVRIWTSEQAREVCAGLYRDLIHCAAGECTRPIGHSGAHESVNARSAK